MKNLPKIGDCFCCKGCGMALLAIADCACEDPNCVSLSCCNADLTLEGMKSSASADVHAKALAKRFPDAKLEHVKATIAGLPILTVLWLLFQFGATFGGQIFTIISDVLATIKKPGGFTLADLMALAGKYGDQVKALVQALLAIFGQPVPQPA